MKTVLTICLIVLASSMAWAQKAAPAPGDGGPNMATEAKHPNFVKNWFVGVGPLVTNAFQGSNGTKYSITLGYNQGLSEHWDLMYFSDNNFNTASQGSTVIQSINAGIKWIGRDRGADNSLFLMADLGYGGGNKLYDANFMAGIAAGFLFYRTGEFTFEAKARLAALYQSGTGTSVQNLPSFTQIMLGIYF